MKFDIFFSICQSKVDGVIPSEAKMFENFFSQIKLADKLGFENAWVAEAHLSTEVQKENKNPVVPNFEGEIGLNTDIFQLAHKVFSMTENINLGSAIMNLLSNGGPIARAEQTLSFLALHGADKEEKRKLNLGFASGRFPYQISPYGIKPRNDFEESIWPILKGKVFQQSSELFLRLLKGEKISSKDLSKMSLCKSDFRDEKSLKKARDAYRELYSRQMPSELELESYFDFEQLKIVPNSYNPDLLNLYMGSHDPKAVKLANSHLPCRVFNLSITPKEVIEQTHQDMLEIYHKDGGPWQRDMMPQTLMVFVNDDKNLTPKEKNTKAREQALKAMASYWNAMQGTVDKEKLEKAVDNTLCGSPEKIAEQIRENYHPEDRIMLWFDFNNHNNKEVESMMRIFKERVMPLCEG